MLKRILLLLLVASFSAVCASEKSSAIHYDEADLLPYQKPGAWDWVTNTPGNLLNFAKAINPVEHWDWWAGITASSLLLIHYDQAIIDASQRLGRKLDLISDTKNGRETHTVLDWNVGEFETPFVIPANTNSVMYFFGDGLAHLGVVGGLLGYGLYNDDNKSLSTASQTMEALLSTGILIQAFKRTAGREAPYVASQAGGKWRWFPNQMDYNRNVPKYDAFPSGHLATVMATTTVLAMNYPTHRYIWPVGGTVMTLLGFAMMNNGVHWAGDYPVGLAIGYVSAKVVVERNRKQRLPKVTKTNSLKPSYLVYPFTQRDGAGLRLNYWF